MASCDYLYPFKPEELKPSDGWLSPDSTQWMYVKRGRKKNTHGYWAYDYLAFRVDDTPDWLKEYLEKPDINPHVPTARIRHRCSAEMKRRGWCRVVVRPYQFISGEPMLRKHMANLKDWCMFIETVLKDDMGRIIFNPRKPESWD